QPIRTVDLRHEKEGSPHMPNRALITGASRGPGLALARALAADGGQLVVDARGEDDMRAAAPDPGPAATAHAVPRHAAYEWRRRAVRGLGRLRVFESRARAVDEGAGRRTTRSACVRRRSRRYAHADAPGRVPG